MPDPLSVDPKYKRSYVPAGLARGVTRTALRNSANARLTLNSRMDRLLRRKSANPFSKNGRRKMISTLSANAMTKAVSSAGYFQASWIEAFPVFSEEDKMYGIDVVEIKIFLDDPDFQTTPLFFIEQHLLQRMAEREARLDVDVFGMEIARIAAPFIYAGRAAGAVKYAIPMGDGVLLGYRVSATGDKDVRLATYISSQKLSRRRGDLIERLRDELPEPCVLPTLQRLLPDHCIAVRDAMHRANETHGVAGSPA